MNNEEKLLILVVVSVSVAIIVGSFRYSQEMRYAPQAAAGATLLFAAVVLVNERNLISVGEKVDLGGEVSKKAASLEKESSEQTEGSVSEVADSGEFRIDLPVKQYELPRLGYTVTPRAMLVVLLFVYAGLLWTFGIFVSSIAFLILFSRLMNINRRNFIILLSFSVTVLLIFGFYLETPLFRPEHDFFDLVLTA
ncbi:MAG: hypothetical protein PPP58_11115 [Natronomonas sp.]